MIRRQKPFGLLLRGYIVRHKPASDHLVDRGFVTDKARLIGCNERLNVDCTPRDDPEILVHDDRPAILAKAAKPGHENQSILNRVFQAIGPARQAAVFLNVGPDFPGRCFSRPAVDQVKPLHLHLHFQPGKIVRTRLDAFARMLNPLHRRGWIGRARCHRSPNDKRFSLAKA